MKNRIISLLVACAMLCSLFALPISADTVGSRETTLPSYSDFMLYADLYQLSAVGHQILGGYACSCFALAYARTITDGTVHYFHEYNVYGNDQYNVSAAWSTGDYYRSEYGSKAEAFADVIAELQDRRPVLAYVSGRGSAQHYVTIVGYENVESMDSLSEANFLILDPIPSSVFEIENMGEVGYQMKNCAWGSEPSYLLIRPFSIVPQVEVDYAVSSNYRYLRECDYYPSSAILCTTEPCVPYTLPCESAVAEEYGYVSDTQWDYYLSIGETVEVSGLYCNTEGEFWYRVILFDGTELFLPSESGEVTEILPPVMENGNFPDRITGATFLEGEIRTNAVIDTIQAKVFAGKNTDGEAAIESDLVEVGESSYSLKYSLVDYTLPFQNLKKHGSGSYILAYEVGYTNYTIANGELVRERRCDIIESYLFYYETSEVGRVTVTFDPNGGTCSEDTRTVEKGTAIGVLPIAERDGYSFEGWYTGKSGGKQVYPDSVMDEDLTLYARFGSGVHRHAFHAAITAPTCEEMGMTTYSCGCGYFFEIDFTEPLGHFWSGGFCTRCWKDDPDSSFEEGAEVVFRLGDVSGKPGELIRIPLTVESKVKLNSLAVLQLSYDREILEFVGFDDCGELENKAFISDFDEDWRVITAGFLSPLQLEGKICDLVFRISSDADGNAGSVVACSSIVKLDSNVIASAVKSARVAVLLTGDIDGDARVDVDDAILLFRHSILPDIYPLDYVGSADFTCDKTVDIDDAVLLFRHSILPDLYPIG